jgi:hypothetical protein
LGRHPWGGSPRGGATYPLRLYKGPPPGPLGTFIPSFFLSSSWLGSHVWNCASELKEAPRAGRCRAAEFPL